MGPCSVRVEPASVVLSVRICPHRRRWRRCRRCPTDLAGPPLPLLADPQQLSSMSEAQRYESVDVEAADGLIQSKGFTLLDVRCGLGAAGFNVQATGIQAGCNAGHVLMPGWGEQSLLTPPIIPVACSCRPDARWHCRNRPRRNGTGHFFSSCPCLRSACRTPEEFKAGHAPEALNIPWMVSVRPCCTQLALASCCICCSGPAPLRMLPCVCIRRPPPDRVLSLTSVYTAGPRRPHTQPAIHGASAAGLP